jgi:hypothetical protein
MRDTLYHQWMRRLQRFLAALPIRQAPRTEQRAG